MADGSAPSAAGQAAGTPAAASPSGDGPTKGQTGTGQAAGQAGAADVGQAPALPSEVSLPGVWDAEYNDSSQDERPAEAPADGQEAQAAEPAEKKAEPDKPVEKFKFGGAEFDSQEAAEHSFKTLRGQYRGMQEREKVAAESAHQQNLAAMAWKAEAERLGYGRDAGQTTDPKQAGQPAAGKEQPAAEPNPLADVDWSLYQQLHDDHGPKVAAAWLYEQTLKSLLPKLTSTLDEKLKPLAERDKAREEQEAQAQQGQQVVSVFQEASTLKFEDGKVAYPELGDAQAAREVGYLWSALELPVTTMGVHLAVLAYRDRAGRVKAAGQAAPKSDGQPGTNPAAGQLANAEAAVNAAASGVGQGAQPPATRPGATPAPGSEAALRADIRNAGNFRSDLGFAE